ncbi:hypothetical protein B0T19DRAFT_95992 [Cercophora scortea]|uniref:Uncharacterized protein n=1 Tax=Cercophora scortea TaxID=314031 RepID=A0AAE0IWA7_9PEZI|nr:hypothetical protein B0T19DRAFT_95992 [Cercophora scortea]
MPSWFFTWACTKQWSHLLSVLLSLQGNCTIRLLHWRNTIEVTFRQNQGLSGSQKSPETWSVGGSQDAQSRYSSVGCCTGCQARYLFAGRFIHHTGAGIVRLWQFCSCPGIDVA